jgi:hypothetical protein
MPSLKIASCCRIPRPSRSTESPLSHLLYTYDTVKNIYSAAIRPPILATAHLGTTGRRSWYRETKSTADIAEATMSWRRAQPSSCRCHLLHLPLLPQYVRNFFSRYVEQNPNAELFRSHCDKKAIERPFDKNLKVRIYWS